MISIICQYCYHYCLLHYEVPESWPRPVSLLRLSLLRLFESDFPENYDGLRVPPLKLKIMLESSPLKSRILVRRFAVGDATVLPAAGQPRRPPSPPRGTAPEMFCRDHTDHPHPHLKTFSKFEVPK